MGKTNLDFRVAARVGVKLTVLVGKSLVDLDFRCREYIVVRSKQNRSRVWRDLYTLPCQHTTPQAQPRLNSHTGTSVTYAVQVQSTVNEINPHSAIFCYYGSCSTEYK